MTITSPPGPLEGALRAVTVNSPTTFTWFGARTGSLPPKIRRAMSAATCRDYLRYQLQDRLYRDFYCKGQPVPPEGMRSRRNPPGLTPFVISLSAANDGSGCREPGWTVRDAGDGEVTVERDGLHVRIRPEDSYAAVDERLEPGDQRHVRFPKELLKMSPGFYMALGDEGLALYPATPIVRFYWNLRSSGAPRLVGAATRALNREQVPFRLKVINDPDEFTRCDAGVLYVERHDYLRVAHVVSGIYAEVAADLKPATPVFTKRLAPGLALAEEPARPSDSFGTHRCGLLAEAIIRAWEQKTEAIPERLGTVATCFAEEGLSLQTPFLNAGSVDDYHFPRP
jgi:class II lanthipeptide synthase